jgi:hypothetical protein
VQFQAILCEPEREAEAAGLKETDGKRCDSDAEAIAPSERCIGAESSANQKFLALSVAVLQGVGRVPAAPLCFRDGGCSALESHERVLQRCCSFFDRL